MSHGGGWLAAVCPPTCRGWHIQFLQAVFAKGRVVPSLGEAAGAVVQHGSCRDDTWGRDFTFPHVHLFNLLLLIDLELLHLRQVSVRRHLESNMSLLLWRSSCSYTCSLMTFTAQVSPLLLLLHETKLTSSNLAAW